MFTLDKLIASFRRSQIRRLAMSDLRQLSAEQLADLGLPSDGLRTVVDDLLAQAAERTPNPAGIYLARRATTLPAAVLQGSR